MVQLWKQVPPTSQSFSQQKFWPHCSWSHVSMITNCFCKYLESCPKNKVLCNSHLSLENIKYANKAASKTKNISFPSHMPTWSFYLLLTDGYLCLLQLQNCYGDLNSYWVYKKCFGLFFILLCFVLFCFSHTVIRERWMQTIDWMLCIKQVKTLHMLFSIVHREIVRDKTRNTILW